jgi:ABC-type Fe3+-hydroxamate transport system substrate-binding protein
MPLAKHSLSKDMMGRAVFIPKDPQRIISLVPSLSELLYSLGLDNRVVGITKFCVHPHVWEESKAKVGGTKKVNIKAIQALNPDLIIANKEENSAQDIEVLSSLYPVWVSDINSFDEALHAIEWLGEITQSEKRASYLNFAIHKAWSNIALHEIPSRTCAYLIWNDPLMAVGRGCFINSILEKLNLSNIITEKRYPEISFAFLRKEKPDYIFLSSEPYPFKKTHRNKIQQELPDSKIILVDGEMFSWYGSRMIAATDYFNRLLNQL